MLRARLFFDEEEMLFGIKPSEYGYVLNNEKINCRQVPERVPRGKFRAYWDDEQKMIIVDLREPI